jgi:hypothetical protein
LPSLKSPHYANTGSLGIWHEGHLVRIDAHMCAVGHVELP